LQVASYARRTVNNSNLGMPGSTTFQDRELTRLQWWRILLRFGFNQCTSPREALRLFYYVALKPSLAFRGRAKFDPSRLLTFSLRAPNHGNFKIHARDNGADVGTLEEFFSSRYTIIPPDLSTLEPKVVYDIGANIGIASLYLATAFPKARFFGFEPVAENYELCRLNYGNLPDSQAYDWAVGQKSGPAKFQLAESDLRGGGLHGAQTKGQGVVMKEIEVQVYSLADLISLKKLAPPDFVKIDVEGAELDVLNGIGSASGSIRRMFVETHSEKLRIECMRWMLDHGFVIVHVHSFQREFSSIWCDRV
jgi:FkbM family methyltransferase